MTRPHSVGPVLDPVGQRLLEEEFSLMGPREQDALLRHGYGQPYGPRTLGELGEKHEVTRERIRQLESSAKGALRHLLDTLLPGWRTQFEEALAPMAVVHFGHVARSVSTGETGLACAPIILTELELKPVRVAKWWYAHEPEAIENAIESLSFTGPVLKTEWEGALKSSGLPGDFYETVTTLIPSVPFGEYLVRKNSQRHGKITAVLLKGPLPFDEIVERTMLSSNSVRGALWYYDDFIALSKGRWALVGTVEEPKYRSALPAVLDILREHGPQHFEELVRRVASVHDVTTWRISQCLDDYRIGRMGDGRIWLVEYGAERFREVEPERPDYLVTIGDQVGIRQRVTFDHARGSGFALNRWLCWRLGLRATPQSMTFSSDIGVELTVTRTGQAAALSSIRTSLEHHGLIEGCDFVIILDVEHRTWRMNHACATGTCPAHP